jgi:hypothetical protein
MNAIHQGSNILEVGQAGKQWQPGRGKGKGNTDVGCDLIPVAKGSFMMAINDWFNDGVRRDRLKQCVTTEEDLEGVLPATILSVTICGRRWDSASHILQVILRGVFHVALRRHVR